MMLIRRLFAYFLHGFHHWLNNDIIMIFLSLWFPPIEKKSLFINRIFHSLAHGILGPTWLLY